MGRIKTTLIKRNAIKIYTLHKQVFKKNFEENKKIVEQFAEIPSKKLRNIIAGYVTRLAQKDKE